jgi:NADP-dependent 3-hydroxy acid dehydrogenase YdfG
VFISNAGIGPISKLEDLRVEDWEEMVDINIKGLLYGIAAALPIFRRQGFGNFVNTISTAGIQMSPTMVVYAATKNAVSPLEDLVSYLGVDGMAEEWWSTISQRSPFLT